MTARDYKAAFGIGLASSVLWFFVLRNVSLSDRGELVAALVALPFAFVAGVALARRIFRGRGFHKLLKFLIVGVLNTAVDFFIFNALIAATGFATGAAVPLFKSLSFACAMLNSYELNRWWTFDAEAGPSRTKREFGSFAAITAVGFLLNVGATSLIIAAMQPPFGITQVRWDNVAAAAATALNLAWNFAGYELFVFNGSKGRRSEITFPNVV